MSYKATIYKVFIATPSDVAEERKVVQNVLAKWNAINAEAKKIILLPVGWDTYAAPETGRAAQDYINQELLDKCDILIRIFWSRIGTATRKNISGTVEEIKRHTSSGKLAMLYFSEKPLPADVDLEQVKMVRSLKEEYTNKSFYGEFLNALELENKLYQHLELKLQEMKQLGCVMLS